MPDDPGQTTAQCVVCHCLWPTDDMTFDADGPKCPGCSKGDSDAE